ncbi:YqeB family protein [Nocardioides nitrophenolicus]|uniref:YqeB family protein n=1 Tax=Nocardioides nitrophenolicus TaxID=60489 RepID=UPI00195EBC53|nr:hypothetical protein [Nocardioides nitrophenolicus]MBM7515064.1 hypothetical protein [Nocardioides nitrophenolicus]
MRYDDLGSTREDKIWTYALLGSGGVLLLTLGPLLAQWLADVPFVPFKDLLRWVGELDQPWAWVARPAVGLLAGLVGAFLVLVDEWRLEVHDDAIVVVHDRDRRRLAREAVVGVHLDGRKVVIEGTDGRRLFDKRVEAKRDVVIAAFRERGYPIESE